MESVMTLLRGKTAKVAPMPKEKTPSPKTPSPKRKTVKRRPTGEPAGKKGEDGVYKTGVFGITANRLAELYKKSDSKKSAQ